MSLGASNFDIIFFSLGVEHKNNNKNPTKIYNKVAY